MRLLFLAGIVILSMLISCRDDEIEDPEESGSLTHIPFDPTPYEIITPPRFGEVESPEDNPSTVEGIALGRMLFFDPILSADSTISCASCHKPELAFTDGQAVSEGIDGQLGRRSAPSLLNVGLQRTNRFFWDGRAATLEQQALDPITNPKEMGNTWEQVLSDLSDHEAYPEHFRRAFGILHEDQIDRTHVSRAIAQFERTLISSGNSEFDRAVRGEYALSDEAQEGMNLFFDDELPDAECNHCHSGSLFMSQLFLNVGLDSVQSVREYRDLGRGEVTGRLEDFGKFKVPTLRNIMLTAPYMHDGRFETMEEVIDHYNSGGHRPMRSEDNVDPLIFRQGLSEEDKENIIAFLHTLTDTSFVNNPDFRSPFE